MKVSLICPVHNEEESIEELIQSMLNQTKKPDEIIFVEDSSTDRTYEIIEKYQKKNKLIKVFRVKTRNIAKNRNIAIKNAKYKIIACTDASSKLREDWLEKIIKPFEDKTIDVVSGGYIAVSKGGIEDYLSMITVKPMEEWDEETFLPSGRSIAFRKEAWKKVGGYPENLYTGEDTLFDLKLKEQGFKFKLARDAIIYWRGRNTIKKFIKQFYLYGKGDGEAKNIFKIKSLLFFFILLNIWIIGLVGFLFLKPFFSLILLIPLLIYFFYSGIKLTIKRKRIGCLFWIPILMLLKRFSYFIGVWKGVLK